MKWTKGRKKGGSKGKGNKKLTSENMADESEKETGGNKRRERKEGRAVHARHNTNTQHR